VSETADPQTTASLGAAFATALAAKDFDGVRDLLHPEVDFRGLTPRRAWEATDAETVCSGFRRPTSALWAWLWTGSWLRRFSVGVGEADCQLGSGPHS
jgi:hypothetical protein